MRFLVWYDPDTQRPLLEKIQAALAAYGRRFSLAPNLVLISASDVAILAGVEIRSVRTVQPNNIWVGRISDDPDEDESASV
jgi:hypothetical protein